MIAAAQTLEEINIPVDTASLSEAVSDLLRGSPEDLAAFLHLLDRQVNFGGRKVNIHCHGLLCNQQGARVKDFARLIAARIVDYAIPREKFARAKQLDAKFNTDANSAELREEARALFADVKQSGEGGEILLYMLIQTFLGIPQLLCKMPLKTSSNVHYHGVDGIHVDIDPADGHLILYWGESKLYQDPAKAVAAALSSLRPFLTDRGGSRSPLDRDLCLLRDNLDLGNQKLRAALLHILDRNKPAFNDIEYRGAALVGFDCESYPATGSAFDKDVIKQELAKQVPAWLKKIENYLKNNTALAAFSLEIFMIPFPDVEKFREAFASEIRAS